MYFKRLKLTLKNLSGFSSLTSSNTGPKALLYIPTKHANNSQHNDRKFSLLYSIIQVLFPAFYINFLSYSKNKKKHFVFLTIISDGN